MIKEEETLIFKGKVAERKVFFLIEKSETHFVFNKKDMERRN